MQLSIVSAQAEVFSGCVQRVVATGKMGELGIYPGHLPLLTILKPGQIHVFLDAQTEQLFYVSGGILEIQPNRITVLSDTAMRAEDLDEEAALQAQIAAERTLTNRQSGVDYSLAFSELSEAIAQLKTINALRRRYPS